MIEPCPFCGVDFVWPHYKEVAGWPEWVECANCHATGDKRALRQDAIDSWNRLSRIVRAASVFAASYGHVFVHPEFEHTIDGVRVRIEREDVPISEAEKLLYEAVEGGAE